MTIQYPIQIKSIRLGGATGFKLDVFGESGGLSQDLSAGPDRYGRNVLIERDKFDTLIFRETMTEGKVNKDDYELLDIVPNHWVIVAKPVNNKVLRPETLKPATVKLGGVK